ncbi:MAG TPA: DUF4337 domain-containing protein [Puia sp.]
MEEIEVPTEHLHEQIQEKAEEQKEKWVLYVALSTAFMAVLAAIAGLLAGHHANEALIERVKASDSWSFYQSKNLKEEIASSTDKILRSLSPTPPKEDNSVAIARYEKEKGEIKKTAEEAEKSSEGHLSRHVPLATAVTCFQIAIAISAIAILTKKRKLWYAGMLLTIIGIVFLVLGIFP